MADVDGAPSAVEILAAIKTIGEVCIVARHPHLDGWALAEKTAMVAALLSGCVWSDEALIGLAALPSGVPAEAQEAEGGS